MKIFVTVGTQKFQFNRLMSMIEELSEILGPNYEFFVQSGYSTYKFKKVKYVDFLSQSEFENLLHKCDILITHGGVGSIHKGLKEKKKVIVVPRLVEFQEHIDSHQLDITNKYAEIGIVLKANNVDELKKAIYSKETNASLFFSGYNKISEYIEHYIREESK